MLKNLGFSVQSIDRQGFPCPYPHAGLRDYLIFPKCQEGLTSSVKRGSLSLTVPGDSPSAAPGSCGDSVVGRMELGLLRALGMGP